MKEIIKKDILRILERVIDILEKKEEKDYLELKNLSDHTIHNMSIFQDEDSISIAVMVYALAKLIDRRIPEKTYDMLFSRLVSAKEKLIEYDTNEYRIIIKGIFQLLSQCDKKLQLYVENVISQAMMKKAGKVYKHGLSVGVVSELMGVSKWELLKYLGQTSIVEEQYDPRNIRKRLNYARKVFNV